MLGQPGQEPITRGSGMGRVLAWIGAVGLLLGGFWLYSETRPPAPVSAESAMDAAESAANAAADAQWTAAKAADAAGTSVYTQYGSSLVVDGAKVLRDDTIDAVGYRLDQLQIASGPQVVVMTLPSLGGTPIKDYATKVANQWGIGDAARKDGVLLLVAPNQKQVRIAVGKGLERVLTDTVCQKIIDEQMLPQFKRGNFDAGVSAGANALADILAKNPTLPRKVAKP